MSTITLILLVCYLCGLARLQSNCTNYFTCIDCFSNNCCWLQNNCILNCQYAEHHCYEENPLSTQFYIISGVGFAIVIVLMFTILIYVRKPRYLLNEDDLESRQKKSAWFLFFLYTLSIFWLALVVCLATFKKRKYIY